jgi:uncharacterized protein (DUF2236 family)
MTVSREQLEAHLQRLTARVRDPRQGLFGPGSMVWRINRERVLFVAGGRAALLQEAHPFVAHGVDQHSHTRTDPAGRFERTFRHVHAMLFGDLDGALASARRVYGIHTHIRGQIAEASGAHAAGSPYQANDEHALLWVHATLWDSSLVLYERLFRPLTVEERERYYQETKLFAYLFGISDALLPPSYDDFAAYNRKMWHSNELFVGEPAKEMARFLLGAPRQSGGAPSLFSSTMAWYRVITAGLLPAPIRAGYGFSFGRTERALFRASLRGLRAGLPLLPRQLRFVPAYVQARERTGRPIALNIAERIVADRVSARRRAA